MTMDINQLIDRLNLKVAHIFGQYYRLIKTLKIFSDDQILYIIMMIILLPYVKNKSSLYKLIKESFELASEKKSKDNDEIKNNKALNEPFLIDIIIQTILNLSKLSKAYQTKLKAERIKSKSFQNQLKESLNNGLNQVLYEDSLTKDEIKNNLINFFNIKEYVKEIYQFKFFSFEGNINFKNKIEYINPNIIKVIDNKEIEINDNSNYREEYLICGLCNQSVNNSGKHKEEYRQYYRLVDNLMKKTDLFATGPEVNFTNKHFICFDCAIDRFIPLQIMFDKKILMRSDIKKLNKENLLEKIDKIILKDAILKHMLYDNKSKREILLANLDD